MGDAELDMRMNREQSLDAKVVVNIKHTVIQAIKFFINLNSYCLKNSFARISTLIILE